MAKLQIKSEKLTLFGGKFSGHGAILLHIVFSVLTLLISLPSHRLAKAAAAFFCCFSVMFVSEE